MANLQIPTLFKFNTFDATQLYYITLKGRNFSPFTYYKIKISNIMTDFVLQDSNSITQINVNIDEYLKTLDLNSKKNTEMVFYNDYYYLIIYPNRLINGYRYSLELSFLENIDSLTEYPIDIYSFSCYSNPIVELESYEYSNQKPYYVNKDIFDLVVEQPWCKLNFSYSQNDGDNLKYHYFILKNSKDEIIGTTARIYGTSNIVYVIENYDNLQNYKLYLYYTTQSGVSGNIEYKIYTNYTSENLYASLTFDVNNFDATNLININISELTGEGENFVFDKEQDAEYVIINDNGYVRFVDNYKVIKKNFLCRIWCKNLKANSLIFTIKQTTDNDDIKVYFDGKKFIAYKKSNGLLTSYISNYLIESGEIPLEQKIYFAIGYYNGRIAIYAQLI